MLAAFELGATDSAHPAPVLYDFLLQIAVALMHKMDRAKHADKTAAAQAFAKALHDAWGVGNPACQNGVLLFLAVGNREVCYHCSYIQSVPTFSSLPAMCAR